MIEEIKIAWNSLAVWFCKNVLIGEIKNLGPRAIELCLTRNPVQSELFQ